MGEKFASHATNKRFISKNSTYSSMSKKHKQPNQKMGRTE